MNGNVTNVYLDLLSLEEVAYRDDRNLGDNPKEHIDNDELRGATADWLIESLAERDDFCKDEGLRILGRHLYQKVFRGSIEKTFDRTYEYFEKAISDGSPGTLRLVITFHPEAEVLAALPWEFLYYAKKETFLSGGQHQLVLTRMVPRQEELRSGPPPERKLSVLAAACTPDGLSSGIEPDGVRKIAAATTDGELAEASKGSNTKVLAYLKKLNLAQRIDLTILTDPEFSELETAVAENPNIIHFIGHGAPGRLYMRRSAELVERDRARSYLAQSAGQPAEKVTEHELVNASKVETLFRSQQPRLVFLQACYGASVGRGVAYSTALEIVKVGVPAVVAMQYEIGAGSADEFALAFYKKLMAGGSIADAVSEGRQKLATHGEGKAWAHRDFGTPVIYMHGDTVVVGPAAAPLPVGPGIQPDQGARTPAAIPERMCRRCGREHCKYRACPQCMLHFYCQCGKNPDRDCDCELELEEPQNAYCGACEHEVEQPPWQVTAEVAGPAQTATGSGLRSVPAAPDSFQAAS